MPAGGVGTVAGGRVSVRAGADAAVASAVARGTANPTGSTFAGRRRPENVGGVIGAIRCTVPP